MLTSGSWTTMKCCTRPWGTCGGKAWTNPVHWVVHAVAKCISNVFFTPGWIIQSYNWYGEYSIIWKVSTMIGGAGFFPWLKKLNKHNDCGLDFCSPAQDTTNWLFWFQQGLTTKINPIGRFGNPPVQSFMQVAFGLVSSLVSLRSICHLESTTSTGNVLYCVLLCCPACDKVEMILLLLVLFF